MGFAFWRSKKRAGSAAAKPATRPQPATDDDADPRLDAAAGLRVRARHRLIGAAALLLAVAIVVPMLLDPEPKPVSENIPIDIPSERTPFTPRLSLPPVPAADAVTPPPDQPVAPIKGETKTEPRTEAPAEVKPAPRAEARAEETKPARADAGGGDSSKTTVAAAAPAKAGKFAVQAAAPASEKAARDLLERLKKAGFATYTEKVETKDGTRYRVRVGPYASREDAEKARARLKSLGVNGNLVTA